MTYLHTLNIAILATCCAAANAGTAADALGKCLGESTTGKERKALARWMFVAMSAHPEIKPLSATTPADMEKSSRSTAALFTKLLTEDCAAQARTAFQAEGPQSMQAAFSVLGQVAMLELTADSAVNAAIGGFGRYMDTQKLEAVFGSK